MDMLRTDSPTAKIVKMSPARALRILTDCNEKNRRCEERRVSQYARDMKAGRWLFTGEAVKMSTEGKLLDGQHRLWAVVEANMTVPLLVITGLDPRAQEVMDQGIPRRLHDALHLRGEHDPNNLAAALRVVAHYHRDGVPFQAGSNPGMSHAFALKLLDTGSNREELIDALRFVSNRHKPWSSRSQMAALHFLFSAADEARAVSFTAGLLEGNSVVPAVRALHAHLDSEWRNADPQHPRAHIKARTVFIVKAWNAGLGAAPEFRWRGADGFPGIAGLDEMPAESIAA